MSQVKMLLALIGVLGGAQVAQAQYDDRVGVYARVDVGCYGEARDVYISNFRRVGEEYGVVVYQSSTEVSHYCRGEGSVRANVILRVPRYQDYVDYNGYLLEPLHYDTQASCEGSSSWSRYTDCFLDNRQAPPSRPPHRPPPRPRPPIYEPEPPRYDEPPQPPIYEPRPPTRPPHRPPPVEPPPHRPPPVQPPPPNRPPPAQPPSQGSPLVVNTEIAVGCRGRVAPIAVTNLTLVSDRGPYLTFRGYNRVNHKCGSTKNIAATVDVSIHRSDARVSANGVLLSPAVNASIQCSGDSDFVGATSCRVTSQN